MSNNGHKKTDQFCVVQLNEKHKGLFRKVHSAVSSFVKGINQKPSTEAVIKKDSKDPYMLYVRATNYKGNLESTLRNKTRSVKAVKNNTDLVTIRHSSLDEIIEAHMKGIGIKESSLQELEQGYKETIEMKEKEIQGLKEVIENEQQAKKDEKEELELENLSLKEEIEKLKQEMDLSKLEKEKERLRQEFEQEREKLLEELANIEQVNDENAKAIILRRVVDLIQKIESFDADEKYQSAKANVEEVNKEGFVPVLMKEMYKMDLEFIRAYEERIGGDRQEYLDEIIKTRNMLTNIMKDIDNYCLASDIKDLKTFVTNKLKRLREKLQSSELIADEEIDELIDSITPEELKEGSDLLDTPPKNLASLEYLLKKKSSKLTREEVKLIHEFTRYKGKIHKIEDLPEDKLVIPSQFQAETGLKVLELMYLRKNKSIGHIVKNKSKDGKEYVVYLRDEIDRIKEKNLLPYLRLLSKHLHYKEVLRKKEGGSTKLDERIFDRMRSKSMIAIYRSWEANPEKEQNATDLVKIALKEDPEANEYTIRNTLSKEARTGKRITRVKPGWFKISKNYIIRE